jgi:hypothetical protein
VHHQPHVLTTLLSAAAWGEFALFRGHQHDKPLTAAEREKLLSEGATCQGMVMHTELSPADRRMSQVRISVRFKDGQQLEFTEPSPHRGNEQHA